MNGGYIDFDYDDAYVDHDHDDGAYDDHDDGAYDDHDDGDVDHLLAHRLTPLLGRLGRALIINCRIINCKL